MLRCAAFVMLSLFGLVGPVLASEPEQVTPEAQPVAAAEAGRPRILPALYVSLTVLQAYDAYSTTVGLSRGAGELNPVMRGIAGNSMTLWTVKAASTAGSIWIAERLWKRNRTAAILGMVVVNGVMLSVAAHNTDTLRRVR
jgi:hypothetical protein